MCIAIKFINCCLDDVFLSFYKFVRILWTKLEWAINIFRSKHVLYVGTIGVLYISIFFEKWQMFVFVDIWLPERKNYYCLSSFCLRNWVMFYFYITFILSWWSNEILISKVSSLFLCNLWVIFQMKFLIREMFIKSKGN